MKHPGTSSDRESLGFPAAVKRAFGTLAIEYGLRITSTAPTLVRYSSDRVSLDVYHGRTSYEIGAEVGRVGAGRAYAVADVLRVVLGGAHGLKTLFWANSPGAVVERLDSLAELVTQNYPAVLRGDEDVWVRIETETAVYEEAETRRIVEYPVRASAAKAWIQKDYVRVARLYATIERLLSEVERRKLEYARGKLPES